MPENAVHDAIIDLARSADLVTAPKDNLVRSASFELVRSDDDDGLNLSGYGAVFGQSTTIDSWEGRFSETIAPGAFRKTLRENGSRVRLQFDHGQHPLIGSMPIGTIRKLREDDKGLFVEARLSDNWLVSPVRDAIREGSIDGMSFRFTVDKEQWSDLDSDLPKRTITEVRLMEVGPVVWPAYEGTSVGVRSQNLARDLLRADDTTKQEVARLVASEWSADEPDALASPTDAAMPGVPWQERLVALAEGQRTSEGAGDATPIEEAAEALGAEDTTPVTYTPARRESMSHERRQAQLGLVRALAATPRPE